MLGSARRHHMSRRDSPTAVAATTGASVFMPRLALTLCMITFGVVSRSSARMGWNLLNPMVVKLIRNAEAGEREWQNHVA